MIRIVPCEPEVLFRSLGLGLWSAEAVPSTDEDPGLASLVKAAERLGLDVIAAVPDATAPGRAFIAAAEGAEPCELELVQLGCDLGPLLESAKGDPILSDRVEMLRRYL